MTFPPKNRAAFAFLAAVMAAIFLAACTAEPASTIETATAEPTAQPSVAPTSTPKPYEDFASAPVPPADLERLARFTRLLSLVPESYGSAVYLDLGFLRSNVSLASSISPEVLGLDLALPSLATGLVNTIAVAVNFETHAVITPFQGDFTIPEMIGFASNFGLPFGEGGPQSYQGHDIWEIDALGVELAMATAEETTGVASGQGATGSDAIGLAKASLDAFDGRSARLLEAPGLDSLVGDVPSGFAAAVLSQCERLPLFADVQALPGCTGVVVTAGMQSGNLVVLHALIGFANQDQARSALDRTTEALASQNRIHGFEDLGVRQEGDNLRVRVIVDVSKLANTFRLFAPGQ